MDKKGISIAAVAVLVLLGLGAALYFYQPKISPGTEQAVQSYGTDAPLEKKPDINPVDKTNPFKSVKTNPFE